MGLFKKLAFLFAPREAGERYAWWLYVQCDRCGEKLRTRIDLRNDSSIQYGEADGKVSYFCRKTLTGSGRCFQPIETELTFDAGRQLIGRQIQGGRFISEEEYLA